MLSVTRLSRPVRRGLVLLASTGLLGCIPHARSVDGEEELLGGLVPVEELRKDPSSVVRQVAGLRGLRPKQSIPIVFREKREFRTHFWQAVEKRNLPLTPFSHPFVIAMFSSEVPKEAPRRGAGNGQGSDPAAEIDEDVVGFYDEHTKTVVMREEGVRLDSDDDEGQKDTSAWVLAHELTHALQDQYFPEINWADHDDDERLALAAVYEGDAMITLTAYIADNSFVPLKRALINMARSATAEADENYLKARGSSRNKAEERFFVEERLIFPYRNGAQFMASIYRAGGFELMNRVYQSPPASTEQILHVEKYLAGERPVNVPVPAAPEGFKKLVAASVGEFQTRVALSECLSPEMSREAAAGWGGDSFSLVVRGETHALLWASAWDTEEDAEEFADAANSLLGCWARRDRKAPKSMRFFGSGRAVIRRGQFVALVYGVPKKQVAALAEQALPRGSSKPALARPPLGPDVTVPDLPVLPELREPYAENDWYVHPELNLRVPLPRGFEHEIGDSGVSLQTKDESSLLSMGVFLSEAVDSPESRAFLYRALERSLRQAAEGRDVSVAERGRSKTSLGSGYVCSWAVTGTSVRSSVEVLPICGGTGSVVITSIWGDPDSRGQIDAWRRRFERVEDKPAAVCLRLNP